MDNRLDFITNINPDGIKLMTEFRQEYIKIDSALRNLTRSLEHPLDTTSMRSLALARTNLEISLQYAIKTLCLQYEIKE